MHTLSRPRRPHVTASLAERADALAVRLSERPGRVLGLTLALDLALAAFFVGFGLLVFGDQAEMFRELMPGTYLSFAQLLLIAAAAWAVHRRSDPPAAWHGTFWGLIAIAFLVFAFDEITQSAIFLSHALEDLGLRSAAGFHDLEAVLLTLMFAGVGLVLLPRSIVLFRYPGTLALLVVAAVLGAASQGLDSFAPATRWEFVAEETLKLSAEAFFIGAFLMALHELTARRPARASAEPQPA
jgi:hypothetical protein